MKSLFVAGSFDDKNGKYSSLADKLYSATGLTGDYFNGGNYEQALDLSNKVGNYDSVVWLAMIPEDKPRISATLKDHGQFVLVSSKRNMDGKLSTLDMIHDALAIKSNLVVEFGGTDKKYEVRVLDPLGNVFLDWSPDFLLAGKVIGKRTTELVEYTRVKSTSIGEEMVAPVDENFLELIRSYATVFSNAVPGETRHLGNASFRCLNGFPSFRKEGLVYVSGRNVDKRGIQRESFVAADANSIDPKYFGKQKPSVDTPIQLRLYQYYPSVNFMLHSHSYIAGVPFTNKIIPCGAIEEADEIERVLPSRTLDKFAVNLLGHGSMIASKNIEDMKNISYVPRALPEIHNKYWEEFK